MSMFVLAVFIFLTGESSPPSELPKTGWLALFDDNKGPAFLRQSKVVIVKDDVVAGQHMVAVDSVPAGAVVLFPRQLFLSGAAKPRELVHQVAEFDDFSR